MTKTLARIIKEELDLRDVRTMRDAVADLSRHASLEPGSDLAVARREIASTLEDVPTSPRFEPFKGRIIDAILAARHPNDIPSVLRMATNELERKINQLEGGTSELARGPSSREERPAVSTLEAFIQSLPSDFEAAKKMAIAHIQNSRVNEKDKRMMLFKIGLISQAPGSNSRKHQELVKYLWSSLLAREVGRVLPRR